jgi:hypothetical protein
MFWIIEEFKLMFMRLHGVFFSSVQEILFDCVSTGVKMGHIGHDQQTWRICTTIRNFQKQNQDTAFYHDPLCIK